MSNPPTPPNEVPALNDSDNEEERTFRQSSQQQEPAETNDDDDSGDDGEVSSDSADENERDSTQTIQARRKLSERLSKGVQDDEEEQEEHEKEMEQARQAAIQAAAADSRKVSIISPSPSHSHTQSSDDPKRRNPSLSASQPGRISEHQDSRRDSYVSQTHMDVEPGSAPVNDVQDAPIQQQQEQANNFEDEDPWEEYFDPNTNHPYYYNPYTNETLWVKPLSPKQKREQELKQAAEAEAQRQANLLLQQQQAKKEQQTQAARALITAQQKQSQVLAQSITQPQVFVQQQQQITAMGHVENEDQPMDPFSGGAGAGANANINFPVHTGEEDEDGDVLEEIPSTRPNWSCVRIMSRWQSNNSIAVSTAGGCYPNFASWRQNPQFQICATGNAPVKLLIELKFEAEKKPTDKKSPAAGFYVFVNSGPSMQKLHVKKEDVVIRSDFLKSGNVMAEVTLPAPSGYTLWHHYQRGNHYDYAYLSNTNNPYPVHYTIVPSTFEPERSGNFCLSIHSSERILVQKLPSYQRWQQVTIAGEWKGASAGGCRNHKSWGANPQYILFPTGYQPSKLLVVLSQPASSNMVAIGLYSFNKNNQNAGKASFMLAPEVYAEILADPKESPYMLVPCTFDPGLEAQFQLSVYAPSAISLYKNN